MLDKSNWVMNGEQQLLFCYIHILIFDIENVILFVDVKKLRIK